MNRNLKIVFLDAGTVDYGDISLGSLKGLGELSCWKQSVPEQIAERLSGAQVAIANKCLFTRPLLARCPDLKLIAVAATGTNNVDFKAAKEHDVQVANVPGYSTASVVERTVGFMLALAGDIVGYNQLSHSGVWSRSAYFTLPGSPIRELSGKILGVVGYGQIGKSVAQVARALGMEVRVAAIPGREESATGAEKKFPLQEVLREADVLTLHCPLSEWTRGLIGESQLRQMKKGAFLINTARGGIVEEAALRKVLDEGHLGGAACDVLTQEPPPENHPLIGAKNLLLSPHVAWAGREARQRLVEELALNIEAWKNGVSRNLVT